MPRLGAAFGEADRNQEEKPALRDSTSTRDSRGGSTAPAVIWSVLSALVLWLVATERWGSYLPIIPRHLYVGDAVVIGSCLTAAAHRGLRRRVLDIMRAPSPTIRVTQLLLAWSVIRLVTTGHYTFTSLRDFAPYGYAVVATLIAALGTQRLPAAGVWAALAAHTAWLLVPLADGGVLKHFPSVGDAPAFATRPDVDGMVCGITIVMSTMYALRHVRQPRRWVPLTLLMGVSAWEASQLPSRGGLLASVAVALPPALWGTWRMAQHLRRSLRAVVLGAAVAAVAAAVGLAVFATPAGDRLRETFALHRTSQAGGTTHARILVYRTTTRYILDSPSRTAVGVGFGPDFLHTSGAARYLEGVFHGVRSPHDYLLGTWARLGVVGLLIALTLTILGLVAGWQALARAPGEPDLMLAGALLVATPIVAAVGVVLESPFGAIPWFWALGVLCRRPRNDAPHNHEKANDVRREPATAVRQREATT